MNPFVRLYEWLGFRPDEARLLWLSFMGAFLVVGYMVLARSLREALYLDAFDVKTLPYITLAVVSLGFVVAAIFSHFLARHRAQNVLKQVILISIAGLLLLWPITHLARLPVILFFLWTALAAMILTAGFWIVIAEHFPLRGAKRLYGWVSGGGTAGAMVIGTSLGPLAKKVPVFQLLPAVIGLLAILFLVIWLLPQPEARKGEVKEEKKKEKIEEKGKDKKSSKSVSLREAVRLVWKSPHLLSIAVIVVAATFASQLLDFQFKAYVQADLKEKAAMAGFFGAFYGWTGGISLAIQIFLTSRLLTKAGIGWTLSILPILLLLGSSALLIAPGFIMATGVRGLDNSVRKSLHRSAIEVLYLPVPSLLRRKTKTFIDSVLDQAAEGASALVIFFLITLANFPSRVLTVIMFVSAACLLWQARRMSRQYYDSLVERLKESDAKAEADGSSVEPPFGQDILDASFSSVNLHQTLEKRGIVFDRAPSRDQQAELAPAKSKEPASAPPVQAQAKVKETTKVEPAGKPVSAPDLIRLLARDDHCAKAGRDLEAMGDSALDPLIDTLLDENSDFVIRRRIPKILAKIKSERAEEALLKALKAERFEIRYRAAIALLKRRQSNLPRLPEERGKEDIWNAIRFEVNHERPVWEMQKILDTLDESEQDDLPHGRVEARGELSLEHVFRMLALVLDPELVRASFHGLGEKESKLRSFALEYLEHVLPEDVREKLWPFIGDISEYQKKQNQRPFDDVVKELLETGRTLFADKKTKKKVMEALENISEKEK